MATETRQSGIGAAETNRVAEEHLIRRAKAGDTDAFADLCERYRHRVWRVVASVTRGGADTGDLAQDAILRAFRSLPSFRGEASFEAWLCRIALNAAHDYRKSAWKRRVVFWSQSTVESGDEPPPFAPVIGGPDTVVDPECEAERREIQRRIRAAVAELGPKERVPIFLIYFEEFSLTDVSRLESVPESTIRSRVKAGLRRLERSLGDLRLPDDPPAGSESLPSDESIAATTAAASLRSHSPKSATLPANWKGLKT